MNLEMFGCAVEMWYTTLRWGVLQCQHASREPDALSR